MKKRYFVSFSGGKDSTAMLHWLLEKGEPVDDIVFFDSGWDFPIMEEHIMKVEEKTGLKISRVYPRYAFTYILREKPVKSRETGDVYRYGNDWPSITRRWCTRQKMDALNKYAKTNNAVYYIGISAEENRRLNNCAIYPLVNWMKTGADCLDYCYSLGYDWGGLYSIFDRLSCFCCPLQKIGELRNLRKYFPGLWALLLAMDNGLTHGFRGFKTVKDLEERFAQEDKQLRFKFD